MHSATKTVLFILSLICLSFASTSKLALRGTIPPQCLDPPYDNCSFYDQCAEAEFQCGPTGYPINYGLKYCTKFSDNRDLLSEQGVKWMLDTMQCLQRTLVPFLVEHANTTPSSQVCDQLEDVAFESHSDCYVENGLCDLPIKDMYNIVFNIVGLETLLDGWDAIKESLEALAGCVELKIFMKTQVEPNAMAKRRHS